MSNAARSGTRPTCAGESDFPRGPGEPPERGSRIRTTARRPPSQEWTTAPRGRRSTRTMNRVRKIGRAAPLGAARAGGQVAAPLHSDREPAVPRAGAVVPEGADFDRFTPLKAKKAAVFSAGLVHLTRISAPPTACTFPGKHTGSKPPPTCSAGAGRGIAAGRRMRGRPPEHVSRTGRRRRSRTGNPGRTDRPTGS